MPDALTYQRGREAAEAIEGVEIHPLDAHRDDRGSFTEMFRDDWGTGIRPVQWNILHSATGALRGMHIHHRHEDYQDVLSGRVTVALADLRRDHPRAGVAVESSFDDPCWFLVPRGVAHGFYFHEPS